MKLLFCKKCQDIVKLQSELRYCKCGAVYGRYIDNLNAEVSENATIIGIDNMSLATALRDLRVSKILEEDSGCQSFGINAFVCKKKACKTISTIRMKNGKAFIRKDKTKSY